MDFQNSDHFNMGEDEIRLNKEPDIILTDQSATTIQDLLNSLPEFERLNADSDPRIDRNRLLAYFSRARSAEALVNSILDMMKDKPEKGGRSGANGLLYRSAKNIVFLISYMRMSNTDQTLLSVWVKANENLEPDKRAPLSINMGSRSYANFIGYLGTPRFLVNLKMLKYFLEKYRSIKEGHAKTIEKDPPAKRMISTHVSHDDDLSIRMELERVRKELNAIKEKDGNDQKRLGILQEEDSDGNDSNYTAESLREEGICNL